ncbi:hypothetical protein BS329_15420 [Amycolatopsis coloradensis]|uniref:Uncharacterized protein n=1 Tax=Amycolatopsis coloradensis TaxID=76021 RepID=A0A1R0KU74_9PSEU|nr:hypothetical protein [Amycolatopsis coloradensis]OLZ51654.1 hypothetical protein BS329_15420 [Amycolatopsis coloradensis]
MSIETTAPPRAVDEPPLRPASDAAAHEADLVLTWDRWSGWAHLARHWRGDTELPAFVGIAQLPGAGAAEVRAKLTAGGLRVLTEYNVDEQLVEFRIAAAVNS